MYADAEAALEQETINLLVKLGWDEWANCQAETAADCSLTGRESRTIVVLFQRLL